MTAREGGRFNAVPQTGTIPQITQDGYIKKPSVGYDVYIYIHIFLRTCFFTFLVFCKRVRSGRVALTSHKGLPNVQNKQAEK